MALVRSLPTPQTARMVRQFPDHRPPEREVEGRRPKSKPGSAAKGSIPGQVPKSGSQKFRGTRLNLDEPRPGSEPGEGPVVARPSGIESNRPDLAPFDPRLTTALDLITSTLDRLDRPAREISDRDIGASQADLSTVLTMVIDLHGKQASRPGRSTVELAHEQKVRAGLAAHRDSRALRDEPPEDPQLRERLVRYLRAISAAVATALVGIVLQVIFDALGLSDALGQATVHAAEAIQGIANQLKAGLSGLVAPALVGGQLAASAVLLNEADELLEALSPSPSATQGADPTRQGADAPEGI
jgi:hypothetical protein